MPTTKEPATYHEHKVVVETGFDWKKALRDITRPVRHLLRRLRPKTKRS